MAARFVTDTTVWRLVVPLAGPLDLTGSTLTAVFRPVFGGAAIAEVSTDDGSITLANDTVTGKTLALKISVPVAARNGWRVQSNTPLAFDVHRIAQAGAEPEWPGRQFITVAPGTDSNEAGGIALGPVFTQAQPYDGPNGLLLPALTTGPQGAVDTTYTDEQVAALQAQLNAALGLIDAASPASFDYSRPAMAGFQPHSLRV